MCPWRPDQGGGGCRFGAKDQTPSFPLARSPRRVDRRPAETENWDGASLGIALPAICLLSALGYALVTLVAWAMTCATF
jgi:hypothetical protein